MNTGMTINQPINDAYMQISSLFFQIHKSDKITQPQIIHNLQKTLNRCVEDLHDIKKQCDENQELLNESRQTLNQENKNNITIQPSQMSQHRQQHQFSVQDPNNSVNSDQQAKLTYPSFLNQSYDQDQPSIQKLNQSISLEKQAHQNTQQTQPKIKIINQSDNTHPQYNGQPQFNQSLIESYVKTEQQKKPICLANGQTTLNFGQVQKYKASSGENEQNISTDQIHQSNGQNSQEKQQKIKKKIQKKQNKQLGDQERDQTDKKNKGDQKDQNGQKVQKVKKNQKSQKEYENKQKSSLDDQNSTNQVELLEWRRKLVEDNHTFSFSKKYIYDSKEKQKQDLVSRFAGIKLEEIEKPENQECLLCSNSPRKFNEQTVKQYEGDKEIWVHPDCIKNATKINNQIDYYNKHSKICGICNQNGAFHKCQHCNQNYHWPCLQNNKGMIGCQCPMNIYNQK